MPYLKDRDQIRDENTSTLYFLLTPFRILQHFLYALGVIGLAIGLIFINQVGWIVDLGDRSERARQDQVNSIGDSLTHDSDGRPMLDITVNFTDRASDWDAKNYPGQPWHGQDHFWITEGDSYDIKGSEAPDESRFEPESHYRTLDSFQLTYDRATAVLRGFPFCHVGHSEMYETKLGSWSERNETILDRKSARMHRDFETAAIMVAALRSALAHLKAGQTLASEYGPASGKPLENSYCNADGADPIVLSPTQLAAYRAATYGVHLDDAPTVIFRYIAFGGTEATVQDGRWLDHGMMISGMCENCHPDTDLMWGTTLYADLFAENPPLNDIQLQAERDLLHTATWDFWVEEARANDITDIVPLKAEFEAAQRDLTAIFGEANSGKPAVESWVIEVFVVILFALLLGFKLCKSLIFYPRRKKIKATDLFVGAIVEGCVPPEQVLKELETCEEEIDYSSTPVVFTNRFGSCATYASAVGQYREERETRRRKAQAEASKHQPLFDRFSALISTCSPSWEQLRRTADALYGIRINASLRDAFKADTLNVVRAFSAANGKLSRPLTQLFVAVSRIWDQRQGIKSRIEEIDLTGGKEISLPATIHGLQKCDDVMGTNHCGEWASAFSALICSASSCCQESIAVSATKQRFHSMLEPYLEESEPSGQAAGSDDSGKTEEPLAESAMCSECARAYELLELPYGSGRAQVAEARRELAKKFHPDVWGEQRGSRAAEEQLKRANAACDHLIRCQALGEWFPTHSRANGKRR